MILLLQSNNITKPAPNAKEESSDFDSSDSENDAPVAQMSTTVEAESDTATIPTTASSAPSAVETTNVTTAAIPAPISLGTGSALRKGANGEVIGPRIVERRPKIKVRPICEPVILWLTSFVL
jgi:hypothetical protein